jgi:ribosome biogenesis ATPase
MDGTADRRGVFIIAASNRPDILDPALLRPGRLDKSLYVPLPDATGRARILEACVRRSPLADDVDLPRIAFRPECEGLSGADLASLLREAAIAALKVGLIPFRDEGFACTVSVQSHDSATN